MLVFSSTAFAKDYLAKDSKDFKAKVKRLKPGDHLIMANGNWKDFEILFTGEGTEQEPIVLRAQEKGKVILSGQSNLRLRGKHLVVKGLVFKDGYSPTHTVIAFRQNKENLAYHSRVTEVVIDNYNKPERFDNDHWVLMYGKHNRFDHNHLQGKRNKGVTFAVRLDTEDSRENHHRIDHNYFGPRPILGANGGETFRIGTSHYSLSNSRTVVENNYFDRCNGELEIISNKSGHNIFRGNVFFESRGTLTFRHGHDNIAENNVFLGNKAEHTGGIRIINRRQTVRNNYLQGLTGYRLGGGFVVMNGVPNSPINRYDQVEDALIQNNTLINVENIQLAAGSDDERSAVPIDSRMEGNLIYNENKQDPVTIFDDISGITFKNNVINDIADFQIKQGFSSKDITLARAANGLLYPKSAELEKVGVSRDLKPISKDETGVSWYPKPGSLTVLGIGDVHDVKAGEGTLSKAIKEARAGDILRLQSGNYTVRRVLEIAKPISIFAADHDPQLSADQLSVSIEFERPSLFMINDGGSLHLQGLSISGASSPDYAGNAVIRTQRRSMLINYEILIEHCNITSLDVNHSFNLIDVAKGSFADHIKITNSSFKNITGSIIKLNKETDDYGIYNAEYVTISDSMFEDVQGSLVDFYRGGTDESTFGPHFTLVNSTLSNVGTGKRNKSGSSINLHGVQVSRIADNKFIASLPIFVNHTVGEPKTGIFGNTFVATKAPRVQELNSSEENTAVIRDNSYQTRDE